MRDPVKILSDADMKAYKEKHATSDKMPIGQATEKALRSSMAIQRKIDKTKTDGSISYRTIRFNSYFQPVVEYTDGRGTFVGNMQSTDLQANDWYVL